MTPRLALLFALVLSACGQGPLRLTVPEAQTGERIASSFPTVEVLDVSLPEYAADDRIFVQAQGGALQPVGGAIWADDPARAVTLELTDALADLTGARVAPEPWPFLDPPSAQVDVRVAEIVADASGAFLLRGRYYVAAGEFEIPLDQQEEDGPATRRAGPDRSGEFRIAVALPPDAGAAAIALARAQATALLARQIAADGLR
jgi:hypothetical protein